MEDIYNNRMNPRDPYYYELNYPERLGAPPESPADEVAFAIAEKLLQKDLDRKMWNFQIQLDKRRSHLDMNLYPRTMGVVMLHTFKHKQHWMLNGVRMKGEELNAIEDAFEGFIEKLEWENE